jgi:riboflavin transporter FmnP
MSEEANEIKTVRSKQSQLTLEIVGAAIFAALSIVVGALITPIIPRVPGWFIAIIDPISIIWIICLLIFGWRSGILCTAIGTVGLMPFDPTIWVGPIMKFAATFSIIIVPILLLKLYKTDSELKGSEKLKKPRNYAFYGFLGMILRIIVMVLLNIVVFATIYASEIDSISLAFLGLPTITGFTAIIIGAPIINTWQSVVDLLVPYLLVFSTGIDEKFDIW